MGLFDAIKATKSTSNTAEEFKTVFCKLLVDLQEFNYWGNGDFYPYSMTTPKFNEAIMIKMRKLVYLYRYVDDPIKEYFMFYQDGIGVKYSAIRLNLPQALLFMDGLIEDVVKSNNVRQSYLLDKRWEIVKQIEYFNAYILSKYE